jgi:hemoglobin
MRFTSLFCVISLLRLSALAGEALNSLCPVTGRPVNPAITVIYEGRSYGFSDDSAREKWSADRQKSLYQRLGGKVAVEAAVDLFYLKVLADNRIRDFFENIPMTKQRRKQKEFLSAAFGGPESWTGKDMRSAHADLGLKEEHFNAVAENLQKTLEELKVPQELVAEVLAIAVSVKDAVLNKP